MARLPTNGSLPNCRYLTNLTVEEGTPEVIVSPIDLSTGEPKSSVADALVTFKGLTGNASLICTYTPPAEKGKGICGPGFIALLAIFAAFLSRRY
ncbi:CGP-CTERM sorting domain-containing protein [Thermococcus sp.]